MSQKYLFVLTVSPVQSFIAQARKTQDLYAGSKLLSFLIEDAIKALKSRVEHFDLIFPAQEVKTKPNRFVAEIQLREGQSLKEVGKEVEEQLRGILVKELEQGLKKAKLDCPETVLTKAKNQLDHFLEVYWAGLTPDNSKSYKDNYEALEQLLGAVKNVREYSVMPHEERGRKCTVNGVYDVIFYRKRAREKNDHKVLSKKLFLSKDEVYLVETQDNRVPPSLLREGEGICALVMLKRVFEREAVEAFPSVAKIALLNILDEKAVKKYKEVFKAKSPIERLKEEGSVRFVPWDDEFLFKENLNFKQIPNSLQLEEAKRAYKDIRSEIQPYYAMIHLDGDKMGKVISGERLCSASNIKAYQKDVSSFLGSFAEKARDYLDGKQDNTQRGRTIYAGGDDFFGLINLGYLFEVLGQLQVLFKEEVTDKLQDKKYELDKPFTFSAGITLTHYKNPLSGAITRTHRAEKRAKEEAGRNAFCLTVDKHSGEEHSAYLKWGNDRSSTKIVKNLFDILYMDLASTTFIRAFGQTTQPLLTVAPAVKGNEAAQYINSGLYEPLKVEFKRLLRRAVKDEEKLKSYFSNNTEFTESPLETFCDRLFELFMEENKKFNLYNFLQFMYIIMFMVRSTPKTISDISSNE